MRTHDSSQAESSSSQNSTLHSAFRCAIFDAVGLGSAAIVDVIIKFCVRERVRADLPSSARDHYFGSLLNRAITRDPSVWKALFGLYDTAEGFTKATRAELGLQVEANKDLMTLLEKAVISRNHAAIELLLVMAADMEAHWAEPYTLLYKAVFREDLKALIKLLDHGARTEALTGDHSPVTCAARHSNNPDVMRCLIDTLHQNPNVKDGSGKLPISLVLSRLDEGYRLGLDDEYRLEIFKGMEECVKMLLERLDVSNPQHIYLKVLNLAPKRKRWDLVHSVAARKDLDKDIRNDCMVTWLKGEHHSGNIAMCEALLDFHAVPEQEMIDEAATWLRMAHSRENFPVCKALLDRGAVPEPEMMKDMEVLLTGTKRFKMLGQWYYWKKR